MRDPNREWRALAFLVALFQILERGFDGIAAGFLRPARRACRRLGLGDALHARFGLSLAGQHRIQEYVDHAAKGDGNQKEDGDNLHSSLRSGPYSFVGGVRRIERGGEAFFLAVVAGAIPETRMANAG